MNDKVMQMRNDMLSNHGCPHCINFEELTSIHLTEPYCSFLCVYMEGVLRDMRLKPKDHVILILLVQAIISKLRSIIDQKLLLIADSIDHDIKVMKMSSFIKISIAFVCKGACIAKGNKDLISHDELFKMLKELDQRIMDLTKHFEEAGYRGGNVEKDELEGILTSEELRLYRDVVSTHEHNQSKAYIAPSDDSYRDKVNAIMKQKKDASMNDFKEEVKEETLISIICSLIERFSVNAKYPRLGLTTGIFCSYLRFIISNRMLDVCIESINISLGNASSRLKELIVRIGSAIIYRELEYDTNGSMIGPWIDEMIAEITGICNQISERGYITSCKDTTTVLPIEHELLDFFMSAYKMV